MARIKVRQVGNGLHPSEVVVEVRAAEGERERLVVDRRSLRDDTLGVGYPVGQDHDRLLVELPRETQRGLWRVWVSPELVVEDAAA